jgi:hypothetical protein
MLPLNSISSSAENTAGPAPPVSRHRDISKDIRKVSENSGYVAMKTPGETSVKGARCIVMRRLLPRFPERRNVSANGGAGAAGAGRGAARDGGAAAAFAAFARNRGMARPECQNQSLGLFGQTSGLCGFSFFHRS